MNRTEITAQRRTRTVLASNAGNVLEWFDFVIFAYLAPYLSDEFFPSSDPITGLIQTYGVFAVGYFMRPLGGLIYGYIGDRYGRRRALRSSIMLMMVPTTLMAFLPTYGDVGALAAVLLIALRILQGLSVGGEQGGAICYLVEIAPKGRHGVFGSLAYTGTVFGILLGSLIVLLTKSVFSDDQMHEWAWRLPFIGGFLLGIVGLWLRRNLHETSAFTTARDQGLLVKHPFIQMLREAPIAAMQMVGAVLYGTVSFYTVFVWLPAYSAHFSSGGLPDPQLINTLALVVLLAFLPIGGHMADRYGYKLVLAVTALISALLIVPIFLVGESGAAALFLGLIVLFAINMAMPNGAAPVALTDMMPAHLRYTGVAFAMNLSVALFGGTVPLVATWLIHVTGDQTAPAWYVIGVAAVSFLTILTIRPTAEKRGRRSSQNPSNEKNSQA